MTITLHSTDKIVMVNGVPGRVWEGQTAGGILCAAIITRIGVKLDANMSEFERDLASMPAPRSEDADRMFPDRMVL